MAYDYENFKSDIRQLTGIDLNAYKERQMKRRIDSLIARRPTENGQGGYEAYVKSLKADRKRLDEFAAYLTINVSEFFRNPEQWRVLEKEIIPELIGKFGENLKIWSTACATGDEPYSLVMALARYIPLSGIHVLATDLDRQVIEKARIGLYNEKSIASVPEDLKKKYFVKTGMLYQLSDEIKARVTFREQNLLEDNYPTGYHMIVCRNVLIYFTEEAKDEVFCKFQRALLSGGVLFVGATEQMMNYKETGYNRKNSFFYEKK